MDTDQEPKHSGVYENDEDIAARQARIREIKELEAATNEEGLEEDDPRVESEQGTSGLSASELQEKEETDEVGEDNLYNDNDEGNFLQRSKQKLKANRNKALIGGGAVAGLGGIGVFIFLTLAPLKVLFVAENLQKRYFASSNSAVGDRVDFYFNRYIVKHVIPSLNGVGACKSTRTIDRTCYKPITESGPVGNMYNAWREARLETKMADKFGFEVAKQPNSNTYVLKVDGKASNIDVEGFRKNPGSGLFQAEGGRNDIRLAVRESLAGESKWKQAMYRWKIGGLLERKYGIRRCAFFCNSRDKIADWKTNKKTAFKALLARRVLEPRSELAGLALGCIFSTDCDNEASSTDGNDTTDLEKKDKLQRNIQKYLDKRGFEYSKDSVEKLTTLVSGITESGGLTKYITKTVISKITDETIAKAVGKAVPVVGWIDMVAQFLSKVENAGPKFKKWAYVVNSGPMVAQGMLLLTHASEIKNGKVDLELMGSVSNSLNGMEKSPIYQDLMGSTSQDAASILLPSAFAASDTFDPSYLCNDGKPVPAGQKVCDEERLKFDNALTGASDLFKQPGIEQIGLAAEAWNKAPGRALNSVGNLIGDFVQKIPGVQALNGKIAELVQPLMEQAQKILPDPFVENPSGGRNFTLAAAGIDVAGNQNGQFGIGGKLLTPGEIGAIRQKQIDEEQHNFNKQPVFARLFDTSSEHSFVGQMAMAMPTDMESYGHSTLASMFSSPFRLFMNIGSIFGSKKANAAAENDPFNVLQYGYPLGDPAITADRPADCDAYNKAWAADTKVDDDTGLEVHNSVNICLLDDAATGSGAAAFDTSVLKPEDLDKFTDGGASPSPSAPIGAASPDKVDVNKLGTDSKDTPCAPGTTDLGVVESRYTGEYKKVPGKIQMRLCRIVDIPGEGNDTKGNETPGGAVVDANVSGAWAALAKQAKADGVTLGANSSFRLADSCGGTGDGSSCARPGKSPHQTGWAIDFKNMSLKGSSTTSCSGRARLPNSPAWKWMEQNAEKYGFKQYSFEAWHWDPIPSANRCGAGQ